MTRSDNPVTLEQGMQRADMEFDELWLRYVAVGGVASAMEVEAYVLGLLMPDPFEHDVIAQAINEYFLDIGQDHPISYWRELHPD